MTGGATAIGDVLDVSARFANALVSLGVKPGDRVAVQVEKSIEALMLYLGTASRRRDLPAAQHRLYPGRDRIFPRRCRACRLRL